MSLRKENICFIIVFLISCGETQKRMRTSFASKKNTSDHQYDQQKDSSAKKNIVKKENEEKSELKKKVIASQSISSFQSGFVALEEKKTPYIHNFDNVVPVNTTVEIKWETEFDETECDVGFGFQGEGTQLVLDHTLDRKFTTPPITSEALILIRCYENADANKTMTLLKALVFPEILSCSERTCSNGVFSGMDDQGKSYIDSMCAFTPAAAEMTADPEATCLLSVEKVNTSFMNSDIEQARLRFVGTVILNEQDFERTGVFPSTEGTNSQRARENRGASKDWLFPYIRALGSDFTQLFVAPNEGSNGLNIAPVGARGVDAIALFGPQFYATSHEFGHIAGGGHFASANSGYKAGFPLNGYNDDYTRKEGPLAGGTHMGGNSLWLFSDPNKEFIVSAENVKEGVIEFPESVFLGDEEKSDMVRLWRDSIPSLSSGVLQSIPDDQENNESLSNCAVFYQFPNFQRKIFELCENDPLYLVENYIESASRLTSLSMHTQSIKVNNNFPLSISSENNFLGDVITIYRSIPNLRNFLDSQNVDFFQGIQSAAIYPLANEDLKIIAEKSENFRIVVT